MAAACATDIQGARVLDLCAGGGGKTLALAAAMNNSGVLIAYDADARRMADLIPRAQRAGVTNLEVRAPMEREPFRGFDAAFDLVFVDAPCTGSGTWRRNPDAKWRLTPQQLERRKSEQDGVLDQAAGFTRPGGRIIYATCSLLAEENEDRVAAFLARRPGWRVEPAPFPTCLTTEGYLRLSPLDAGTDGFFTAVLRAPG